MDKELFEKALRMTPNERLAFAEFNFGKPGT